MKRFWLLRKYRKAKRTGKPVRVNGGLFKKKGTYPIYLSVGPVNEDDPYYKEKLEDAIRFLEKHPIPDYILERVNRR